MANTATTIIAVAKFHGHTDVFEPPKVSVPIKTIKPLSYVPGRVFLSLLERTYILDRLTIGCSYEVVIDTVYRTAKLARL